jgi:predicted RNA-binding Zn ribbon-like protein
MADKFAYLSNYVKPGELCLDFVNSKLWGTRTQPFVDLFTNYERIVNWCRHLNILSDKDVELLLQLAEQMPNQAQAAFEKITAVCDANYHTFTAIARQQTPASKDLDILNQILSEAMQHRQVISTPEGFAWHWTKDDASFDWMLWPVALSTAELLTSERIQRVRECNGCYWMFVDTSRNGLRRWCDMKTCGNRAKAHRHYERVRNTSS